MPQAYLEAVDAIELATRRLQVEMATVERRLRDLRASYRRLLEVPVSDIPVTTGTAEGLFRLTRRERLVAGLAADGRSNVAIAAQLHVSVHTVKSQMRSILRKLDVDSRWRISALLVTA